MSGVEYDLIVIAILAALGLVRLAISIAAARERMPAAQPRRRPDPEWINVYCTVPKCAEPFVALVETEDDGLIELAVHRITEHQGVVWGGVA